MILKIKPLKVLRPIQLANHKNEKQKTLSIRYVDGSHKPDYRLPTDAGVAGIQAWYAVSIAKKDRGT